MQSMHVFYFPLFVTIPITAALFIICSMVQVQKNRTFSDPVISVHQTRLELARVSPHAPQACVSTDSTTGANAYLLYPCKFPESTII